MNSLNLFLVIWTKLLLFNTSVWTPFCFNGSLSVKFLFVWFKRLNRRTSFRHFLSSEPPLNIFSTIDSSFETQGYLKIHIGYMCIIPQHFRRDFGSLTSFHKFLSRLMVHPISINVFGPARHVPLLWSLSPACRVLHTPARVL